MKMFTKMIRFEWRYFTRQPSFYVLVLMFFVIPFLIMSINDLGLGGGNILKNGPFIIGQTMVILGIFSMFLVVNFIANTALRDDVSGMSEILYCSPVDPLRYQLGRFIGSFAVVVAVYLAVPFGLVIGSLMPWVNDSRIGLFRWELYASTFLFISVPTLFVFSCIFYALAVRLKSMMAVYLAVVAVIILYEISDSLFNSPETRSIASMLDPFAARTFAEITRYWTVHEKNTQVLNLEGILLINRSLWLGVGVFVMWFFGGFARSMSLPAARSSNQKADVTKGSPEFTVNQHAFFHKGEISAAWPQFKTRTLFELKQVILDPAFFILCGFTFFLLVGVLFEPMGMFGSSYLPLTYAMVELIRAAMGILSLIIITYYSAEIVWRERSTGMGDIIGSVPVSNLVYWMSKLVAVWMVLLLLLLFSVAVTVSFQLITAYYNIEPGQYLLSLAIFTALPWMMLTVLAFLFQVLSPNKYVGMSLFVLFILSGLAMEPLGLGHNMFRFSKAPSFIYSDMNGYGNYLVRQSWYMLYWGSMSFVMSILGYGLWQRGPQEKLRNSIRKIGYQLGQGGKWALAGFFAIFVMSGSFIYYNTNVLNEYMTEQQSNERRAEYEKKYVEFIDDAVPAIIKLVATVDIYPQQRKVVGSADLVLVNRSSQVIERFLVSTPGFRPMHLSVEIEGGYLAELDDEHQTRWFEFEQPLMPGESRTGRYEVVRQQAGFVDKDDAIEIVENGTFINNTELFPRFGYQRSVELIDIVDRQEWNLPPARRAHKLEDSSYYQQTIFGPESGYLEFEATVSTTADQIAIAPGYLQKEWLEGDRRFFHYKMDAPIENYFAVLSGRYEVLRSQYKGIDIEIFYHPGHAYNVQVMQQAIIDSIDYFGENFGPYQHTQARIIEFPGYKSFAQSFPNTIAYSERIGFINDLSDPEVVNSVYYVTAHEMAHQWWGGQVDGANVQGSTMIVETLAQYSALMVTKKKYGLAILRTILKFELDSYLRGRTRELIEELPLMRVENQDYIHYRKGSVTMMSLVDLLGEGRMNAALRSFLAEFKFKESGYPTTLDLLAHINRDADELEREAVRNLFEEISLYDLRMVSVNVERFGKENSDKNGTDAHYEVTLVINAHRVEADGQGMETEASLSEYIDIGLFSIDPDELSAAGGANEDYILYLQKHLINDGENIVKIRMRNYPSWAGIDPFVKMIDRDSADNTIRVRPESRKLAAM